MSPRPNFQGVSPVLMSSSCVVGEASSGIPDSGRLSYPFRKAIVLEEIRWTISAASLIDDTRFNLGALVSTKLQLGNNYLMRDAVPIWLLGTLMARSQEQAIDVGLSTPTVFSQYRWRLPEPLFVDAGEVLQSEFSRGLDGFGTFGGGGLTVKVSYVGKTVPPNQSRPRIIPVPYVAPWVTRLGQTYEQSNEFDLFNPFDVPLRVQRLTGRLLNLIAPSGPTTGTCASLQGLTPVVGGSAISILMDDSWGGKMVNNNTGPGDVFDCLRASWTVDTELPPKGVYNIRAWNIPTDQQLHVALIGVREERS